MLASMLPFAPRLALAFLSVAFASAISAHPIPDVPVRASFDGAGGMVLRVEVDPRCFEADPNKAPSVLQKDLAAITLEQQQALREKAGAYAKHAVQVNLDPPGAAKPDYHFEFTAPENTPLAKPDDIVVLTGTWNAKLPDGAKTYGIKALPEGTLSVLFSNEARGQKLERFQVLFPGESSYQLDLNTLAPLQAAKPTITATDEPTSGGISLKHGLLGGVALIVLAMIIRNARRR